MYAAIMRLYLVRNPTTRHKYVSACLVWWIISSFIALSGISVIISAVERIEHESWIIEQVAGMLLELREFLYITYMAVTNELNRKVLFLRHLQAL